jgi:hypothetical protein
MFVAEGFERSGKVLHEGLPKLVDQGSSLLDQRDFVMAQLAQLLAQRIPEHLRQVAAFVED